MVETKAPHIGRKIERIRTIKGIKQETLATSLGVTQAAISKMEQSEEVDEEKLKKVAEALGVSVDAIKNFSEEHAVNIVANAFHDNSVLNGYLYNPTFNPIDKVVELYERLLETERQRNKELEEQIKKLQS